MRVLPILIFGLSIFAGCMWLVQYNIQQLLQIGRSPIVAQKTGYTSAEAESIVTKAFQTQDLQPPPTGKSHRMETDALRAGILSYLQDRDVEVYVIEEDNEIRWRIYNKYSLQYQFTFSNTQTDITGRSLTAQSTHTTITKPVALLLTGTKYKDLEPLLDLDIPLNLALEPHSPFALRNAVLGARHWHEIVLDIRTSTEFVLDALPFATALLSTTSLPIESKNIIVTSDTIEVSIDQTNLPDAQIWRLNMTTLSTEDVQRWLDTLPTSLIFVRLSYWDIAPK